MDRIALNTEINRIREYIYFIKDMMKRSDGGALTEYYKEVLRLEHKKLKELVLIEHEYEKDH